LQGATEIFAGRDNHPFLSTFGASHFAFVFFTGLQPQVKLHLNISPHELMKTSFTEIVRRAQGVGLLVEERYIVSLAEMGHIRMCDLRWDVLEPTLGCSI